MAKPLFDRIAADLKSTGRLADCRRDLLEAERELERTGHRISAAEKRAEDPKIGEDEAQAARHEAADLRFHSKRLARGISELKEAIATKEADESYQARRDEFRAAEAARDALAERWRAFGEAYGLLTGLIRETIENDRLLTRVNNHRPNGSARLLSAEVVARGALNDSFWPNSIGQNGDPFARLTAMGLPRFDGPGPICSDREEANTIYESICAGLRAAATARDPQAIAAAKESEQSRFARYEVRQQPYCGHAIGSVGHRDGLAAISQHPVTLWMHSGHVAAARAKGLAVVARRQTETAA